MRNSMMNALRKAGSRFKDFDTAYAEKLTPGFTEADTFLGMIGNYGRGVPLHEVPRGIPMSEYEAIGGIGPRTQGQARTGAFVDAGLMAANVASRYALPAGGITLAGKGLFDLTQGLYAAADATPVFGGPEDGSQPGQLPLY